MQKKKSAKNFWNIEVWAVQKHVNLVDLVKFETDSYSNEYLLAKIGVDTAENEPLKVHLILQPWDLIFTEPPRPRGTTCMLQYPPAMSRHSPGAVQLFFCLLQDDAEHECAPRARKWHGSWNKEREAGVNVQV